MLTALLWPICSLICTTALLSERAYAL